MKLIRLLFLLTLVTMLSACDNGGSDNPLSGPSSGASSNDINVSIVSGPQLGTNSTNINQLRKNITFSIVNPNNEFTFGSAYAARTSTSSGTFYWIVEITNIGNQTHCFIRLNDGRFLANDNTELGTDSFSYVNGRVRTFTNSSVYTNTCLAPGDRGHVIGIEPTITMDQISHISYNTISVSSSENQASSLTMEAVSYSAQKPVNSIQSIDLVVKNNGPVTGVVGSLSLSILLDDNDNPLIWSYFSLPSNWSGELTSGQTGTIQNELLYHGVSHKLIIYLDFDALAITPLQISGSSLQPTLNVEDFSTVEEYQSYVLDVKNQNERLKQLSQ